MPKEPTKSETLRDAVEKLIEESRRLKKVANRLEKQAEEIKKNMKAHTEADK